MDIEQQYDKLLRYCYMKLRDRALAEDLTQETFIKFFESKDYHSIGKEMAYLYTIARNLCIDYFRKQKEELIEDLPAKIQEMPDSSDKVESIVDQLSI
jgi:RNA polymerase sigma-70 factor (ECF subfamily)